VIIYFFTTNSGMIVKVNIVLIKNLFYILIFILITNLSTKLYYGLIYQYLICYLLYRYCYDFNFYR